MKNGVRCKIQFENWVRVSEIKKKMACYETDTAYYFYARRYIYEIEVINRCEKDEQFTITHLSPLMWEWFKRYS